MDFNFAKQSLEAGKAVARHKWLSDYIELHTRDDGSQHWYIMRFGISYGVWRASTDDVAADDWYIFTVGDAARVADTPAQASARRVKIVTWGDPLNEDTPVLYGLKVNDLHCAAQGKPVMYASRSDATVAGKQLATRLGAVFDAGRG